VGAINGAYAAQEDFDLLRQLWLSLDDGLPMDGIKGFLAPAITRGRALFHLGPMRDKLEQHISLAKFKTLFSAGVVLRETMEYKNLFSDKMKSDDSLWDAIQGSSSISGLMEPINMKFRGKIRTVCDGGHLHIVPQIPDWASQAATDIDIILTNPIKHSEQLTADVDGLLESLEWTLEANAAAVQASDLRYYKRLCDQRVGMTIRVFAPLHSLGSLLKADKFTIRERMTLGEAALREPIVWRS
jgi:predicted acylesterase/phospholipase RssA